MKIITDNTTSNIMKIECRGHGEFVATFGSDYMVGGDSEYEALANLVRNVRETADVIGAIPALRRTNRDWENLIEAESFLDAVSEEAGVVGKVTAVGTARNH